MTDITTMSGPQAIAALSRELSFAIARAQAAEARVAELEDELGRLRSQLADRRWRISGAEMPDSGGDVVEIRATGWHTDEHWYIYVYGDLVCNVSIGNPYIKWRPLEPYDDKAGIRASLRRSWEEVQEGRIRPVGELWDGTDEEE